MSKSITLSKAIEGMLFYKRASGKSPHTLNDYRTCLDKLRRYFDDDPPLDSLTRDRLVRFFAWLRDDFVSESAGVAKRAPIKLSPKTILNTHTAVSALWNWAVEEGLAEENIVRAIAAPKVNETVIEPLDKEQIERMLAACARNNWKTGHSSERPTGDRDRAIVLLLLDSGLRAQELCDLTIGDVHLEGNSVKVLKGKGQKERIVYFGKRTAKALWKYLLPRLDALKPDEWLFLVDYPADPRPMGRQILLRLVKRIGERAGVPGVHPHRFRHTMAINYLRNGGDVFTLQNLLGHSNLETVKRYARIAQLDVARVHQTASPVDNWKL